MAMYTPLPFVGKPLDQSEQQMRLVDLMYQAQLARIQKEQEARLQGANMFMNLGMQLPQILNTVEQNRIREMQAAADQQRARAYEESLKRQRELDEQRLRNEEERVREDRAARMAQYMPGGYELPMEDFTERIAGTAVEPLFRVMPTQAVGEQAITPGETMTLRQLAQPDALGARPLGISALGGTAQMEDAMPLGGYAAKQMSPDELRAMKEAQDKAAAARVKQEGVMAAASLANVPPDQRQNFAAMVSAGFPIDEAMKFFKAPETKPLSFDQLRASVAAGTATPEQRAAYFAMLREESKIDAQNRASGQPEGKTPPVAPVGITKELLEINDGIKQMGGLAQEWTSGTTSEGYVDQMFAPEFLVSLPDWVTRPTGIGTAAKKKEAVISMARQIIGKALEGGVLRPDDEIKFKRMLPALTDSDEIAQSKLGNVQDMLMQRYDDRLQLLKQSGYNVTGFETLQQGQPSRFDQQRLSPDDLAYIRSLTGGGVTVTPK